MPDSRCAQELIFARVGHELPTGPCERRGPSGDGERRRDYPALLLALWQLSDQASFRFEDLDRLRWAGDRRCAGQVGELTPIDRELAAVDGGD